MKQVYTYFWKTLPIGDVISLNPISLAFSKSSQIGPSSSNHPKSANNLLETQDNFRVMFNSILLLKRKEIITEKVREQ